MNPHCLPGSFKPHRGRFSNQFHGAQHQSDGLCVQQVHSLSASVHNDVTMSAGALHQEKDLYNYSQRIILNALLSGKPLLFSDCVMSLVVLSASLIAIITTFFNSHSSEAEKKSHKLDASHFLAVKCGLYLVVMCRIYDENGSFPQSPNEIQDQLISIYYM